MDEEYTRGLLYPDHAAPEGASTRVPHVGAGRVGDFDDWSGLELDCGKDFRVMIAQDALGDSDEPCILFDTHPIQQSESPTDLAQRAGSRHTPAHRRGGSTISTLKSPTSPLSSKPQQRTFSNGATLSFPVRNRSSTFAGLSDEHDPRHLRNLDSKDEARNILNCAFGSSAGASSGTKMHVLSIGGSSKELPLSPSLPGLGASTSAGYFRKREPVASARTSALFGVRPAIHERSHSSSGTKAKFTDALLITKLFSVNLPEPTDLQTPDSPKTSQHGGAQATQSEHNLHSPPTKGKKPRAKKTPVFAIILVVHLPTKSSALSRPSSLGSTQTPPASPSAPSFQDSFNINPSSPKFRSFGTPIDRGDTRVTALVDHWDVINRALTRLEDVIAPKILGHLKQVDHFSAALASKPAKPKEKSMQRTNQISIFLNPLALGGDLKLKDAAMQAVQRIRSALRIPRVTVGQGRWGLWNDELIRISRGYGGREQNFFILNLLTSFLGAHTAEWMTLLAPSSCRRRRSIHRRPNDPDVITTRTVVVSNDRSIARRLIFFLSSFLDAEFDSENGGLLHRGRGSSISLRNAILHSPSMMVARPTQRRYSAEVHQRNGLDHPRGDLATVRGLRRKSSDIRSIKSIPIPANDLNLRKNSAATTSTTTPNPTTPVPQFSSGSGPEAGYFPDESNASASLNKIWRNAHQDGESSTASTKWGSLLSGFWSKDSPLSASESTGPSASSSMRAKKGTPLNAMSRQVENDDSSAPLEHTTIPSQSVENLPSDARPVKLEVNAFEGVIDVDIGIPSFLSSSNDSAIASPTLHNMRHVSSAASLDSLAPAKPQLTSKSASMLQSRVAGFLPSFHPDYSLQAVRVSKSDLPDLIEDIKAAMLSEPFSQESATSGWIDVCTTLIANVHSASVKRLRLKRRVSRPSEHGNVSNQAVTQSGEQSAAPRPIKRSAAMCNEFIKEEAFSYESVMDVDPLLRDAFERILARESNHGSRSVSPAPPFSHSRQTSTGTNEGQGRGHTQSGFNVSRPPDENSRALNENVVASALEDVVKSVNHDLTERRRGVNPEANANEQSPAQATKAKDNALREGVRSWLLNVEHTAVW